MDLYFVIVVALLLTAVFGLVVGVSNDAVNFMNSAVGSLAAKRNVIVAIAGVGIFAGVFFSGGMMEVARKSIFYPSSFVMPELVIIFIAVMVQNILLLDLYNTFGMPTSTTISVVFGLFGSALAMAMVKVINQGDPFTEIYTTYVNSAEVSRIVGGIFAAIIVAFIVGFIVQFITRLLFTFEFKKRITRYGAIWGGLALTFIVYFLLVKGAKGSEIIPADAVDFIKHNKWPILGGTAVTLTIIFQLLTMFTKVNILRVVVLAGTFSLAMAFAANDLVNFIGPPIAAYNAHLLANDPEVLRAASEAAGTVFTPETMPMSALGGEVPTPKWQLLIAGIVMIVTLFLSKKAQTVTKTEINLGRQEEGFERFESYPMSRIIVRFFIGINSLITSITPEPVSRFVRKRFDLTRWEPEVDKKGVPQAFDLLRASVNLCVAAAIISLYTSKTLPISTTYITFIVAMATALPDKAWGRESAVYRVSGVLTVVGGWLFTALLATLAAGLIAGLIYWTKTQILYGDLIGIAFFVILSAIVITRSSLVHKKRTQDEAEKEKEQEPKDVFGSPEQSMNFLLENYFQLIDDVEKTVNLSFKGIRNYKLKHLKKANNRAKKLQVKARVLTKDFLKILKFADEKEIDKNNNFAGVVGSLHVIEDNLHKMTEAIYLYFDNNHHRFLEVQVNELERASELLCNCFDQFKKIVESKDFANFEKSVKICDEFLDVIAEFNKNQIKRIKRIPSNTKRSLLFLNILDHLELIYSASSKIVGSAKDFYVVLKAEQRDTDKAGG